MSELFREIEQDIRNERWQRLWHSFGKAMVAISLAIVLGTAGGVAWKDWRKSRAEERTDRLLRAVERMEAGDYKGGIGLFDATIEDDASPYAEMALLRKAGAQALGKDEKSAAATYETLAARRAGGEARVFVELGALMAGKPMPAKDAVFNYTGRTAEAWRLLDAGKKDEAVAMFAALRDDKDAPVSLRQRARLALEHLAPATAEE